MVEMWLNEEVHPYYRKALCCEALLVDEQTDYQHLQVVQTKYFGKTLLLDGIFQLTERDNAGYHEMIAHVPLLAQAQPESVLIVGGGDGGSLQQVLRYPSVKQAVVCELDRRVAEVCAEHFPDFGHPFEDPRAELVVQDAFQYLQNIHGHFDVIISDTTDDSTARSCSLTTSNIIENRFWALPT